MRKFLIFLLMILCVGTLYGATKVETGPVIFQGPVTVSNATFTVIAVDGSTNVVATVPADTNTTDSTIYEYITFPYYSTNVNNVYWIGPWAKNKTLLSAFSKTPASTSTVDIIEQATNELWSAYTTNLTINGVTNGITATNWSDSIIEAGHLLGFKVNSNLGTNCLITIKVK